MRQFREFLPEKHLAGPADAVEDRQFRVDAAAGDLAAERTDRRDTAPAGYGNDLPAVTQRLEEELPMRPRRFDGRAARPAAPDLLGKETVFLAADRDFPVSLAGRVRGRGGDRIGPGVAAPAAPRLDAQVLARMEGRKSGSSLGGQETEGSRKSRLIADLRNDEPQKRRMEGAGEGTDRVVRRGFAGGALRELLPLRQQGAEGLHVLLHAVDFHDRSLP